MPPKFHPQPPTHLLKSFFVGPRFAIVGPNGIGKSTLLNLIGGSLEPTSGTVVRNPRVRLATFSQHHVDGLDLALTPIAIMCKGYPDVKEQELRAHLGSFGVSGNLALQPLYTLSGGQKSRVALAKVRGTWGADQAGVLVAVFQAVCCRIHLQRRRHVCSKGLD